MDALLVYFGRFQHRAVLLHDFIVLHLNVRGINVLGCRAIGCWLCCVIERPTHCICCERCVSIDVRTDALIGSVAEVARERLLSAVQGHDLRGVVARRGRLGRDDGVLWHVVAAGRLAGDGDRCHPSLGLVG